MAEALQARGIRPDLLCGYSLGEYAVACAAGALPFGVGLRLLLRRARALRSRVTGRMLLAYGAPGRLQPLLGPELFIAGYNGPAETVLSGSRDAIAGARDALFAEDVAAIELEADQAFHSPLVELDRQAIAPVLASARAAPARAALVSTVTGEPIAATRLIEPAHWIEHLRQPVRFAQAAACLMRQRPTVVLKLGTPSLTPLVTAVTGHGPDAPLVAALLPHRFDRRGSREYLEELSARLWTRGTEAPLT